MSDAVGIEDMEKWLSLKEEIWDSVKVRSERLPEEYSVYTNRARRTLVELERLEKCLSSTNDRKRMSYMLSVLVADLNEYLQSLHDVAEDRAIRQLELSPIEIRYIGDLTTSYYDVLKSLYPLFAGDSRTTGIVEDTVVELNPKESDVRVRSRTASTTHEPELGEPIHRNSVDFVHMLADAVSDDELSAFRSNFLYGIHERLVRYGMAVKTDKDKRKLRYIMLSNYRLLFMSSLDTLKQSYAFREIKKVGLKDSSHFYVDTVFGIRHSFFCVEAESWVQEINSAISTYMDQDTEVSPLIDLPEESRLADSGPMLAVTVHELANLQANAKGRDDHPYCVVGIGNPTHFLYKEDGRIDRKRTKTVESLSSAVLNETLMFPVVSDPAGTVVDLRVYSHLGRMKGNDFTYGICNIALDDVLLAPGKRLSGWFSFSEEPSPSIYPGVPPVRRRDASSPATSVGVEDSSATVESTSLSLSKDVVRRRTKRFSSVLSRSRSRSSARLASNALESSLDMSSLNYVEPLVGVGGERERGGGREVERDGGRPRSSTDPGQSPRAKPKLCGSVRLTMELQRWEANFATTSSHGSIPALQSHDRFEVSADVPLVFGSHEGEAVAFLKYTGTTVALNDAMSRRRLFSLEKSSFMKKEYQVLGPCGAVFAKCFHKMKTKKKKIRMFLNTGEWLFSMEGGCFNKRAYDNEVYIKNSCKNPVAAVVLGDRNGSRVLKIRRLQPGVDCGLLIIFAIYVLRTTKT